MSRVGQLRDWLSLVRFSHSIFALPFALAGAFMAAQGMPSWRTMGLIVVCAVAARTAAMAFNRWADRVVDAANPRTRTRELPAGRLAAPVVLAATVLAALVFVAAAWLLNPLAGWLAAPVLVVLLGYSYMKRISAAAHFVLGVALAIAPGGAWIAVRGELGPGFEAVVWLAAGVLCWVTGFDLIYACQDADFDRGKQLFSVPSHWGIPFALRLALLNHLCTIVALFALWHFAGLGTVFLTGIVAVSALLLYEHSLVRPNDLSRVNVAFFNVNAIISVGLFAVGLVDLWWR